MRSDRLTLYQSKDNMKLNRVPVPVLRMPVWRHVETCSGTAFGKQSRQSRDKTQPEAGCVKKAPIVNTFIVYCIP